MFDNPSPYSPLPQGRAEQSEGREGGGRRREGGETPNPLLAPAPWNLYIVLLFGFFVRDKIFPINSVAFRQFLPATSCNLDAKIPGFYQFSCYAVHSTLF